MAATIPTVAAKPRPIRYSTALSGPPPKPSRVTSSGLIPDSRISRQYRRICSPQCAGADEWSADLYCCPHRERPCHSCWFADSLTAAFWLLASVLAEAAIPQQERDTLIAFYNATRGANWHTRTGWLGSAGTECAWYGVTCDSGQSNVNSAQLEQQRSERRHSVVVGESHDTQGPEPRREPTERCHSFNAGASDTTYFTLSQRRLVLRT